MAKIDVTDEQFESLVVERSRKVPVVVDFWASWCGPCVMLGPVLDRLSEEFGDRFVLAKVSVEENQEKAREYNVTSIPAVKLFKNGRIVSEFVGAKSEGIVREWLKDNI